MRISSGNFFCGRRSLAMLLTAALLIVPGGVACWGREAADNPAQPNILLIVADDLGYGDIGCYGNDVVLTPHLDRLASEGIRFTDCYSAAANCSPSRAGLMTGRTPWRIGIHDWIPFMSPMHVMDEEITIAELLRDAGYDCAHFGKWHLNGLFNLPGQPQPDDQGFAYWFSTQNNALPNHQNPYNFVRNRIPMGPLPGFAGPIVATDFEKWLQSGRDAEKPFFAYVCFHEPHEPIATDPQYERLYERFSSPSQRAHHGNVTQLDASVGKVLAAIERYALSESTLVLFTSDNGPAVTSIHPHGSAGPLREKKGHVYEGGVRVPGIVRWPGRIEPGKVSSEPIIGTDMLPTLCAVAGITPPQDRQLDGTNILPALEGKRLQRTTPLYWHFYGASSEMKVAIRDGDWKLLAGVRNDTLTRRPDITEERIAFYREAELDNFELYNLAADVGEKQELSDKHRDVFDSLQRRLLAMHREVRDESPSWPAWEWPRYEGLRIEWPPYRGK